MFSFMGIEFSKVGIEFALMASVYYFYFGFTGKGSLIAGAEQAGAVALVDLSFASSLGGSLASLRKCGLSVTESVIFGAIRLFFHSPRYEAVFFIRPMIASLIVSFASMAANRGLHSSAIIGAEAAGIWKRSQEIGEAGVYSAEPAPASLRDAAGREERGLWD